MYFYYGKAFDPNIIISDLLKFTVPFILQESCVLRSFEN